MTTPLSNQQLDEIETRANVATDGPWTESGIGDYGWGVGSPAEHIVEADDSEQGRSNAAFIAHARTDVPLLVDEVRRLQTENANAVDRLLPAWEAMYEPGNVSDYLIGYTNSEAAAKGAAEAWMRSEAEVTGRLEWVEQNPLDGYDREFELVERHTDGVDTGPGITVRHRAAAPAEERQAEADPSGCRWCGVPEREHLQRWKKPVGWHTWEQPTQEQIKERMHARRAARGAARLLDCGFCYEENSEEVHPHPECPVDGRAAAVPATVESE